jgi:hypothetical protein
MICCQPLITHAPTEPVIDDIQFVYVTSNVCSLKLTYVTTGSGCKTIFDTKFLLVQLAARP